MSCLWVYGAYDGRPERDDEHQRHCGEPGRRMEHFFKGHIPALVAFVIYLISGNAEANRGPFDLAEAEQELTAGYHTEYSGMHFGFFYLAEYLNLFITAGIATTLFLGGWMPLHVAGLDGFNAVMDYIPGIVWFLGKTFFVIFLLMWILVDLPPFAYRPGADAGMEIPHALVARNHVDHGDNESFRTGFLKG